MGATPPPASASSGCLCSTSFASLALRISLLAALLILCLQLTFLANSAGRGFQQQRIRVVTLPLTSSSSEADGSMHKTGISFVSDSADYNSAVPQTSSAPGPIVDGSDAPSVPGLLHSDGSSSQAASSEPADDPPPRGTSAISAPPATSPISSNPATTNPPPSNPTPTSLPTSDPPPSSTPASNPPTPTPAPTSPAPPSPTPQHFLALLTIFKNEAHILQEWLEHNLAQGVDHFVLIDNNSSDPYRRVLQPYIDRGLVTLEKTPEPHIQTAALNHYYGQHLQGRAKWVLLVDPDEFVYASTAGATIASVLRNMEALPQNADVTQVCVPWKMFGSSGYTKQPRCVVPSFTKREDYKADAAGAEPPLTKCVVMTAGLKEILIHHHDANGTSVCADGSPRADQGVHAVRACRVPLETSLLQLNHYALQAKDFFMAVKATRGDVVAAEFDNVRDESYFNAYNGFSDLVLDTGLVEIQKQQPGLTCRNETRFTTGIGYQAIIGELLKTGAPTSSQHAQGSQRHRRLRFKRLLRMLRS